MRGQKGWFWGRRRRARRATTLVEYGLVVSIMSAGTCCFYLVLQSQFEASFMRVAAAIDDEGNYAWTVFNDYSGGDGRMDRAEFGTSAQEWCDGGPASCGDPVLDTTFATYDKNTDATIDSEEWLHMVDDDVIS